jgi:hypothetical protein
MSPFSTQFLEEIEQGNMGIGQTVPAHCLNIQIPPSKPPMIGFKMADFLSSMTSKVLLILSCANGLLRAAVATAST